MRLQSGLDILSAWCDANDLHFNTGKCKIVSFSRCEQMIHHSYNMLSTTTLARLTECRDLGVTFQSSLTFAGHIAATVKSATKTLGYILRNCLGFSDPEVLLTSYSALVGVRLEYGSIVWFSVCEKYIQEVEKVQRKLLKFVSKILDGMYPPRGSPEPYQLQRFGVDSIPGISRPGFQGPEQTY